MTIEFWKIRWKWWCKGIYLQMNDNQNSGEMKQKPHSHYCSGDHDVCEYDKSLLLYIYIYKCNESKVKMCAYDVSIG